MKLGFARLAIIAVLLWLWSVGALVPDPTLGKEPAPLTVERIPKRDLRFGTVAVASSGGTVVIDPATGFRTFSGGAFDLGGTGLRAEFSVRGEPGTEFTIDIVPNGNTLVRKGGQTVGISLFKSSPPSTGEIGSATGEIGSDGKAKVFVGATLTVAPFQPPGKYRGLFDIIVDSF